ncbi:MAG: TIGR00282 family metallophosphoesterase [Deltaproteobacteria bacterium]|nr:TIGR00282 family metallophosphoesterase [Deltaproteobacteria bacterium]
MGDGLFGILFIGDIIGKPGRNVFYNVLPRLRERYSPDFIIANGENSAAGFGITPEVYKDLTGSGIDVITSGNHIWDKKEILESMDSCERLLRPANYPESVPGRGCGVFSSSSGVKVGVINLSGRVFMKESIDCPFKAAERMAAEIKKETPVIFIDFHAEATSEKGALARHLDGRVSALVGTHTHVQTSDETVLSGGTAFITDAGMTGPVDSVIGVDKELVIKKFLTGMPVKWEIASTESELQGVFVKVDVKSGRAVSITRIKEKAA